VKRESFQVEAIGEIETEENVLMIKRIAVRYRLAVPAEQREDAERVHGFHARFCPVARSLEGGIEVRTELELV
jgi:organic hydroperoxide reductase OsmC/OhrA